MENGDRPWSLGFLSFLVSPGEVIPWDKGRDTGWKCQIGCGMEQGNITTAEGRVFVVLILCRSDADPWGWEEKGEGQIWAAHFPRSWGGRQELGLAIPQEQALWPRTWRPAGTGCPLQHHQALRPRAFPRSQTDTSIRRLSSQGPPSCLEVPHSPHC